jgi:hypothetical protein
LEENASRISGLLANVFALPPSSEPNVRYRQALATAYYALSIAAYNTKRRDLSKRFLLRTLVFSPKLLWDRKIFLTLVKSYLNPSFVDRIKRFVFVLIFVFTCEDMCVR